MTSLSGMKEVFSPSKTSIQMGGHLEVPFSTSSHFTPTCTAPLKFK